MLENLLRKFYDASDDAATSAAINASSSILSSDAAVIAQSSINKQTRNWNEKMYNEQRTNALADWNMQNAYNAPTAQMDRYKAAGLNPNLIYGTGSDASNSGPVRASSVQSWSPQSPTGPIKDIGNAVTSYQDTVLKQAQINNLQTETAKAVQDTALSAANTLKAGADTSLTGTKDLQAQLDLGIQSDLRDITEDYKKAELTNLQSRTSAILNDNDRQWLRTNMDMRKGEMSLQESMVAILQHKAETLNTQARTTNTQWDTEGKKLGLDLTSTDIQRGIQTIQNMQTQNQLQKLEQGLRQNGISPGDPAWERWIEIMFGQMYKGTLGNGTTSDVNKGAMGGTIDPSSNK